MRAASSEGEQPGPSDGIGVVLLEYEVQASLQQ